MVELANCEFVESKKSNGMVSMIAGKKLVLKGEAIRHFDLKSSDIGRNSGMTAKIAFDVDGKKMYICRQKGEVGAALGGNLSRVEIYNSGACQKIMQIIERKLAGSGTVGFGIVEFDELANGEPCIIVDLTSYTANSGVFVESEVAE